MGASSSKADLDNHSNQGNPNHSSYTSGYSRAGTTADLNNHSNQLNPNDDR